MLWSDLCCVSLLCDELDVIYLPLSVSPTGVGRQRLRRSAYFRKAVEAQEGPDDIPAGNLGGVRKSNSATSLSDLPTAQDERINYNSACAAAAQHTLMSLYETMFTQFDVATSQLLVTSSDFTSPDRRRNINYVLSQLLALGIVPLVNENDAVSANQGYENFGRSFSDNDSLAALISGEISADLLILLTDVQGCYDRPPTVPGAQLIDIFDTNTVFQEGAKSLQGRGGMGAKVDSALTAIQAGVPAVVIAAGNDFSTIDALMSGEKKGTLFMQPSDLSIISEEGEFILPASPSRTATPPTDEIDQLAADAREGGRSLHGHSSAARQGNSSPFTPDSQPTLYTRCTCMLVLFELPLCRSIRSTANPPSVYFCVPSSSFLVPRSSPQPLSRQPPSCLAAILHALADGLLARADDILVANAQGVTAATASGAVSGVLLSRLTLTIDKLNVLATGIRSIAAQVEPLGKVLTRTEISTDLVLDKITAPIGVLLVIFESRPDCLPQIAALAIRSGNGLMLKGGKEAARSNAMLHSIVQDAIDTGSRGAVSRGAIALVQSREDTDKLLALDKYIDLVIPRGGASLVKHIQNNTKIPVMAHADGVCHMYIDLDADIAKAARLAVDAKCNYPSACNAIECLLIHRALLQDKQGIMKVFDDLRSAGVVLLGSPETVELGPECPELGLCSEIVQDYHTEVCGSMCVCVCVSVSVCTCSVLRS